MGFVISYLFSDKFKLSRRKLLIPYVFITNIFIFVFFNTSKIDFENLFYYNWLWGIVTGIIVSVFLVKKTFSQPNSRKTTEMTSVFDLIWAGLIYGLIDALFLNVLPVIAVFNSTSIELQSAWADKWIPSILALFASMLVTLAYHLGYAEFRNRNMRLVLFGNMLITLAFLISSKPLGAIISHTAMHIAAVVRGAETTIQLPLHR